MGGTIGPRQGPTEITQVTDRGHAVATAKIHSIAGRVADLNIHSQRRRVVMAFAHSVACSDVAIVDDVVSRWSQGVRGVPRRHH
jgi:hypothetical protein